MSDNKIKVYRYRTTPYIVNFPTPTGVQSYQFAGNKKGKKDFKMLPSEVVQWLQMSTSCFKKGQLVIEKEEIPKDSEVYIDETELEEYKKNTHTREEVEEILKGNFPKMKSILKDITSESEKRFFVDVAKEINIDSVGKRKFLAEWIGVDVELLFIDTDDEE